MAPGPDLGIPLGPLGAPAVGQRAMNSVRRLIYLETVRAIAFVSIGFIVTNSRLRLTFTTLR